MKKVIALIEDDSLFKHLLEVVKGEYEIIREKNPAKLKKLKERGEISLIVVEPSVGGRSIEDIKEELVDLKVPLLLYTASLDAVKAAELQVKGIVDEFAHALEPGVEILSKINRLIAGEKKDVRRTLIKFYNRVFGLEEGSLKPALRAIIAYSPRMADAVEKALHYAKRKDLNILIVGEPGTGRSRLVEFILEQGEEGRKILKIEAGEYGYFDLLMEERVAGYKREEKVLYETVVLEGLEDLPEDYQITLFNLLKSGRHRWIVTATPRLFTLIAQGKFRGEVYEYLMGGIIYLPPLRDRLKEDIALLLEHFLRMEEKEYVGVSEEFYRAFLNHNWPGNVVELKSRVISALARMNPGEKLLDIHHIDRDILEKRRESSLREIFRELLGEFMSRVNIDRLTYQDIEAMKEDLEYVLLKTVLTFFRGDIKKTAEFLKTDPSTLKKSPVFERIVQELSG